MKFKYRLARIRASKGMTQTELADRSGLHPSAISHFEIGSREPELKNIIRLCQGLNCKPNDLIDV